MKVLLVDDEEELVSTMAERLSLRGIDADWSTSAEDALRKLETCRYDVAVLDVKIPRINGIELKKQMERKCSHTKFIFLTGHGSDADFRAGSAEAGAEFYLVKPVNIEDLIQKMDELVET
ncbi:MAG: response regulator [Deltaproteobacteria bacterium]|nr:response regulator [Deltaproteobacteria bacterium]